MAGHRAIHVAAHEPNEIPSVKPIVELAIKRTHSTKTASRDHRPAAASGWFSGACLTTSRAQPATPKGPL
jgi:hypothetical protein